MDAYSISFTLGKASNPHGANLQHNNRKFLAANIANRVFAKFPQFGHAQTINVKRCINYKKVTGHHAIIPTANITAECPLSDCITPDTCNG